MVPFLWKQPHEDTHQFDLIHGFFNHHSVDAAGLRAQALGDSGNHGHTDLSLEAWR